jgi:hypothetical protein
MYSESMNKYITANEQRKAIRSDFLKAICKHKPWLVLPKRYHPKKTLRGKNPNPRIGVLLQNRHASNRLKTVMWQFRLRGLKWLLKNWPEARMRKELRGYGPKTSAEWNYLLRCAGYSDMNGFVWGCIKLTKKSIIHVPYYPLFTTKSMTPV